MPRFHVGTAGRLLTAVLLLSALAADGPPAANRDRSRSGTQAKAEKPQQLDPRGRMDDHPTDKPARYYLWHDTEGWHVRSCSRLVNKFEGKVRIEQGTFRKLRPIGIDSKGRGADQWTLNKDRNELKFVLNTATSFDGFDFTVDEGDAELEFELLVNGKPMPARIFAGRDGGHPREAKFTFPADPERLDTGETAEGAARQARPAANPRARGSSDEAM